MDLEAGLPVLLVRGFCDLAMYPLLSMSVIMQGSQPYSTQPREREAIETGYAHSAERSLVWGWKIVPPCVQDILQRSYFGRFRSQYRDISIYNAIRLCQTYTNFTVWPKDWWGYCKVCTLSVLDTLAFKPL